MKRRLRLLAILLIACGINVGITGALSVRAEEKIVGTATVPDVVLEKTISHDKMLKITRKEIPYTPPDNTAAIYTWLNQTPIDIVLINPSHVYLYTFIVSSLDGKHEKVVWSHKVAEYPEPSIPANFQFFDAIYEKETFVVVYKVRHTTYANIIKFEETDEKQTIQELSWADSQLISDSEALGRIITSGLIEGSIKKGTLAVRVKSTSKEVMSFLWKNNRWDRQEHSEPSQPASVQKPIKEPSPPPPTETLFRERPSYFKVMGTGLVIQRQKTPLTRIPEGFKKPKETLVPLPPGYLYWAEYHRWDDGTGYVSHYVLWKKELETQDSAAQLEILDATYSPEGEDKREQGVFIVAYLQEKVLFATVTYPGKDGNRTEMPFQDAILQKYISRGEIKSAEFIANIKENLLTFELEFTNGNKKQWKLTQINGKETWVIREIEKTMPAK